MNKIYFLYFFNASILILYFALPRPTNISGGNLSNTFNECSVSGLLVVEGMMILFLLLVLGNIFLYHQGRFQTLHNLLLEEDDTDVTDV